MNEPALRYVEVKVLKHITMSLAKIIVKKGTIDILITEAPISQKVKMFLDDSGIIYYDNVTPEVVANVNAALVMEEKLKEKSLTRLFEKSLTRLFEIKRGK